MFTNGKKISTSMLNGSVPENKCAIYINNSNGVHYDIVLDVSVDLNDNQSNYVKQNGKRKNVSQKTSEYISTDQSPNKRKKKEYNVISKKSSFNTPGKPNESVKSLNQSCGHIHNSSSGSKNTNNAKNDLDNIDINTTFKQRQREVPCMVDKTMKTVPYSNSDKASQKHISKFHKSIEFSISQYQVCYEAWPLKSKPKSPYTCRRCLADKVITRQPSQVSNKEHFSNALRLFYSNEQVAKYNYENLIQLNEPIGKINARHSCSKAKSTSAQEMFGLQPTIFIAKGARVLLTMNLWPSVGLCNGSTGVVEDIIYAQNDQPPLLPIAVVVKFDNYIGPSVSDLPYSVPISPVTVSTNFNNTFHERQQIPLTLAWALTIHKSQGMTLDKAWIDIGKKETCLGISYVALSRVRNLSSAVIEPMTFDRLRSIVKSKNLKYRMDEENRLLQIANQTKLH